MCMKRVSVVIHEMSKIVRYPADVRGFFSSSAYIFLSRAFSTSNSFIRAIIEVSILPYLACYS